VSESRVGRTGERVHQIVFGSSKRSLIDSTGMGPIASSIPVSELARWSRLCNNGDLLSGGWADIDDPDLRPVVGGLIIGQDPAIGIALRLFPALDGGRPSHQLHVLLGPPGMVNAHLSLGLHDWDGWLLPGKELPAELPILEMVALREIAETGRQTLLHRAERERPALTHLVSQVLATPTASYQAPLTHDDDVLAITARLLDTVGPLAGRDAWTVLIGGIANVDRAEPRLLILADRPATGTGSMARTTIRTTVPAGKPDEEAIEAAQFLLDSGTPTRPPEPFVTRDRLLGWVNEQRHQISDVAGLLRRIVRGEPTSEVRAMLHSDYWRDRIHAETASLDGETLTMVLGGHHHFADAPGVLALVRQTVIDRCLADTDPVVEPELKSALESALKDDPGVDIQAEVSQGLIRWSEVHSEPSVKILHPVLAFCGQLSYDILSDTANQGLLGRMPSYNLLVWAAESLKFAEEEPGTRLDRAREALTYLSHASYVKVAPEVLGRCRTLIEDGRLLMPHVAFDPEQQRDFYRHILRLVYCPLNPSAFDLILNDVHGPLSPELVTMVMDLASDQVVYVLVAANIEDERAAERQRILRKTTLRELVRAAQRSQDHRVVHTALVEISARDAHLDQSERSELGEILVKCSYLASSIAKIAKSSDDRVNAYCELLRIVHGWHLSGGTVGGLIQSLGRPLDPALAAAIMIRAAPGDGQSVMLTVVRRWLHDNGMTETITGEVHKAAYLQPPPPEPQRPQSLEHNESTDSAGPSPAGSSSDDPNSQAPTDCPVDTDDLTTRDETPAPHASEPFPEELEQALNLANSGTRRPPVIRPADTHHQDDSPPAAPQEPIVTQRKRWMRRWTKRQGKAEGRAKQAIIDAGKPAGGAPPAFGNQQPVSPAPSPPGEHSGERAGDSNTQSGSVRHGRYSRSRRSPQEGRLRGIARYAAFVAPAVLLIILIWMLT
jgi:hypothetical protein